MTQVSSLPSSTANVNDMYNNKRLPKGIHVIRSDEKSARKVEGMSESEVEGTPWGYLFIQHFAAEKFEKHLKPSSWKAISNLIVLSIVPSLISVNQMAKAL